MENWRRYVSINEGMDSRIQKQLDALLKMGDVGVAITKEASFGIAFKYILITDPEADHPQFQDMAFPGDLSDKEGGSGKYDLYGQVEIYKSEPAGDGECFDGHIVLATGAQKGWGPLLYEIALEWASQNSGGLTADRGIVSPKALAVWDKYVKRADVDVKQMDISHELSGTRDMQKDYPQLTPEEPADDCDQGKAVAMAGPDWSDLSLSKMYYKPTPEVMQALKAAKRLIEV
jgi:hypothetical protein